MQHTVRKTLLLCCILAFCLTGCTADKSTDESTVRGVQLSDREKKIAMLGDYTAAGVLEFSCQQDVQGYLLQREIWKYGELTETGIMAYGGTDSLEALYIGHKQEVNSEGFPEFAWRILEARKSATRKFAPTIQVAFPEGEDIICGWASDFLGRRSTEPIVLEVGKSYILSVESIDLGDDGWQDVWCGEYAEQEQNIKDSDCVILLRMDTFATAKEAKAEAETKEQEKRAKL